MNRRNVISLLCSCLLVLSAAPAMAQTPTDSYGPTIPLPKLPDSSSTAAFKTANQTRSVAATPKRLPFTGVDVRLIALGGTILLGAGFALRRGTRPRVD